MGQEESKPSQTPKTRRTIAQPHEKPGEKPQESNIQQTPTKQKSSSANELASSPGMFIQHSTQVFSDRYKGQKVLGKGSFGEVILCKDRVTGQECAVKVICKKQMKKKTDQGQLLREVELLKKLDHPNIMKLYEFFEEASFYYLVGEVYSGGELFDEIVNKQRFCEADAARIIKQVLSGIVYMHKNNVVHRDLKPENLLLESKNKDANIKIIDFGLSTHFEFSKKMKEKIGTAYYIAPEVLRGTYDEKCDVWSCGVILYILLSGSPPFNAAEESVILKKVEKGKYSFDMPQWKSISAPAKDLIRKMLMYVPSTRISAREALEHEWIRDSVSTEVCADNVLSLEATIKNMRQFQGQQKIVEAALLYMGSKLTSKEETKELLDIFRKLDKNGDGQLDRSELIEGYVELMKIKGADIGKLNAATIEVEVDQVLSSVDFDKNGYIEYSEFLSVAMDRRQLLSRERLQKAFKLFDVDNNGRISSSELAQLFGVTNIDSNVWKSILSEADKNNDGEVDFEEFQTLLFKLTDS